MSSSSPRLCVPGCSDKIGQQFPLGLGQLARRLRRRSARCEASPRARAADRDHAAHPRPRSSPCASSDFRSLSASGIFLLQMRRREWPRGQHLHHLIDAYPRLAASIDKLPRGIAARIGQRINFAGANIGRQRQHRPQHFAQRRAVIAGDPASPARSVRRSARVRRRSAAARPSDRLNSGSEIHRGPAAPRRSACACRTAPAIRAPGFTRCCSVSGSE